MLLTKEVETSIGQQSTFHKARKFEKVGKGEKVKMTIYEDKQNHNYFSGSRLM
jgi:hypothetical protein